MVSVTEIMVRKSAYLVTALLVGMLLIAPGVYAQEARLSNFIITNTRDDLLLYLNVEGAFPEETKGAILSGMPTTFTFYVSLYRVRDFWYDEKIIDLEITHDIKYDSLKNEFTVTRSWESGRTRSSWQIGHYQPSLLGYAFYTVRSRRRGNGSSG